MAAGCAPDPRTPEGLYHRQCARCHAVDGRGNPRAARRMEGLDLGRSAMVAAADREEIRRRIADGEGSMPAFADKLTPEQIDVLVEHVLELAARPAADTP